MPDADVEAIIQAAGQGERLGLGPKAFVVLSGKTLLERAVATMLDVARGVCVAVPSVDVARASALVGGPRVTVIAGGDSRAETFRGLIAASRAPWLVLHDVVHPFVDAAITRQIVSTARQDGAAAAALPNSEFAYGCDGRLLGRPGEVMAVQKPIAFRRSAAEQGLRLAAGAGSPRDPGALEVLALAGVRVRFVVGSPTNIKITTADDLSLARAIASIETCRP